MISRIAIGHAIIKGLRARVNRVDIQTPIAAQGNDCSVAERYRATSAGEVGHRAASQRIDDCCDRHRIARTAHIVCSRINHDRQARHGGELVCVGYRCGGEKICSANRGVGELKTFGGIDFVRAIETTGAIVDNREERSAAIAAAGDRIIAARTREDHRIVTGSSVNRIVASAARDRVVGDVPRQCIGEGGTTDVFEAIERVSGRITAGCDTRGEIDAHRGAGSRIGKRVVAEATLQ